MSYFVSIGQRRKYKGIDCPYESAAKWQALLAKKEDGIASLNRQEQELIRLGVPVSRQTMANWVVAAYERWFSDFFQVLRRELLSNDTGCFDPASIRVVAGCAGAFNCGGYVWQAVLFGKEGTDMIFEVYHADGSLCYEGGSWPMARLC